MWIHKSTPEEGVPIRGASNSRVFALAIFDCFTAGIGSESLYLREAGCRNQTNLDEIRAARYVWRHLFIIPGLGSILYLFTSSKIYILKIAENGLPALTGPVSKLVYAACS